MLPNLNTAFPRPKPKKKILIFHTAREAGIKHFIMLGLRTPFPVSKNCQSIGKNRHKNRIMGKVIGEKKKARLFATNNTTHNQRTDPILKMNIKN